MGVDYVIVTHKKKTVGLGVVFASMVLTSLLAWNFWFEKDVATQDDFYETDLDKDAPFEVSTHDVLFAVGAGAFVRLKPKKALKKQTVVKVVLDDPDILETIGSFTVSANSARTVFIPLHSRMMAGHCVMSFHSKSPELENLYKMRINIKVVREIYFGYLSIIIGWLYFVLWSVVYYPQIYHNWKRKSVVGLSFDYVGLNLTGHFCYLVFNAAMYENSYIQKEYHKLHRRGLLPVHANDLFFSVHAVAMNIVFVIQCSIYDRGDQKVSLPVVTLICGLWLSIFSGLFAAIAEKVSWLTFVYYLSYIKVGTTPIKYAPQVYMHYINKSTEGWSIYSVLLDVGGSLTSFTQMLIDAVNNDDWDGTVGNPGKLGLSIIGVTFDSIFMFQHFILYSGGLGLERKRRNTDQDPAVEEDFHHKLASLKASLLPSKLDRRTFKIYEM